MADIKQCGYVLPHDAHSYEEQSEMPFGRRSYHYCFGISEPAPATPKETP